MAQALASAQKHVKLSVLPKLPVGPPLPRKPEPEPVPSYPANRVVAGGLITRKPANRVAARVTARASWICQAPYEPSSREVKTLPEVEAQFKNAVEHIQRLEAHQQKMREHFKRLQAADGQRGHALNKQISDLQAENAELRRQNAALTAKLSIAALWTPPDKLK